MFTVFGTPIGGGIVTGRACVVESRLIDVPRYRLAAGAAEAELERLKQAVEIVTAELQDVAAHLTAGAPSEARALLDVHIMILNDPALIDAACDMVRLGLVNAEWAIAEKAEELAAQFREIDDPYLRERGRDVEQVTTRLLKALAGSRLEVFRREPGEALIFVAHDITPADMLQLKGALGFLIELGGSNSHTAILARSLNIASVVGATSASKLIRDDDMLILDGETGVVIVNPDEFVLNEYRERQQLAQLESLKLGRLINVPSTTLDGQSILLMANIEQPEEAVEALRLGAAGIGLFRSEFLFLNKSRLPDEDEQYRAYADAVTAMQGRPVTIRTIDIGADKTLAGQELTQTGASALGQRAIRYSLAEPDVFLTQLRALLRAAAHGPLRILLPMLSHSKEIDAALILIERAREQLRQQGKPFGETVPVGGMIEVPAAALSAGWFVQRLDFLSIGTNDLVQYTLAIDRSDPRIAHLYDEFHPAVLRLIAGTIRAACKAGKPVSVCGEMAGDAAACALLLGMGLTEFSMHPASLLRVKREVLRSEVSRLVPRVRRLLAIDDPVRMRASLDRLAEGREPLATRRWEYAKDAKDAKDASQRDEQAVP
ncbi:MAG: phosphoenolpyruvate--protein phosphotransferase [Lautropia sp.]|nr:phosphoenolpyruvate--protein phosphotransferase [Lautropia sp.]